MENLVYERVMYTLHGHKLRIYVDIGSAICDRGHYR